MGHYKLILVLLLASTVSGATVGTPVTVATGVDQLGATLGIPRLKCGIRSDSLFIIPSQGSGADSAWFYSADGGVNWVDVRGLQDLIGGADEHMAAWFDAGGAHITLPQFDGGNQQTIYRRINAPMTTAGDTSTFRIIATGWPAAMRSTICSRGDTTWVAARIASSGFFDTIYVYWSIDEFATAADSLHYEIGSGTDNVRIMLATDDSGLPHLWFFKYGAGFYQTEWGGVGSGFAGAADSVVVADASYGAGERAFTVCYTNEWQLVYGEGSGGDDTLVHIDEDGGSWTRSVISANDDLALDFAPMLTERNDVLYVFYFLQDEQQLVFESNGGGWGDSTLVSASDVVDGSVGIQTPYSIPASLDYIPVWYVTTGDVLRFNALGLGAQGLSGSVSLTGGVTIQ